MNFHFAQELFFSVIAYGLLWFIDSNSAQAIIKYIIDHLGIVLSVVLIYNILTLFINRFFSYKELEIKQKSKTTKS